MADTSVDALLNDLDNILNVDPADRRLSRRYDARLKFRFSIFYDPIATKTDNAYKQAVLQNLSQGGACFHTKMNLNRGSLCRLILSMQDDKMEIRRLLRVHRVKRISGKYEIGGQFVDEKLDPKLERRKNFRNKANLTVDYAFPDGDTLSKGVALNISRTGLLLAMSTPLALGDILRINLGTQEGGQSQLILYGKVVRFDFVLGQDCAGIMFIDYAKYLVENQRIL